MTPILSLLAAFFACNAAAVDHTMAAGDAMHCSQAYEELKWTFLTEDERAAAAADIDARAEASKLGFRRLSAWLDRHPEAVREWREVAASAYEPNV